MGTYDVVLTSDMEWHTREGVSALGPWKMTTINFGVVVEADVAESKRETQPAVGRYFFPSVVFDRANTRSQTETKELATALGMESIRGLLPTYIPADAADAYDGGIVEHTKGLQCRIRVTQGKLRVNEDTDEKRPGRFYFKFSPIPA